MTEKEFKAKTEALKDSCRIYRKEKQTLLDMEKAGVNYIPLPAPNGDHSLGFRIRERFLRGLVRVGIIV